MAKDKNKHLNCVLKSHYIENNEALMKAYREKRNEVREDLKVRYGADIYRILHSGSYKKKTAINIKFDMDLVVPFKKNIDSLEGIFNDMYEFFNDEYRKRDSTLFEVKRQKIAIGLLFRIDGHILDLDIVPGREINDYETDGNLNVYVNDTMGGIAKGSYIRTNIQKQIDNIRANSTARESIKLMKVWKRRFNGQIKSMVIELICIKAFENFNGNTDNYSKLTHVIEFIRDNIKTIRLVDPGNSNNDLSKALDDVQKENISNTMKWMIDGIKNNENSLEAYFPINPEYPCEDDKRSIYIVGSTAKPDKLNNEDFG